ncbi:DgyrCDS11650 [Dimorphilus gyrociliatus]|uniref:DgyrCDS11650 n=1 Tax=Dimorphilus gyrociliatus TaxID=2664684 RepID=A0A7I8W524_9ANNE|nr:DgyrCDS11650 [Dimorphilus gyrociliatus]
MAVGKKNVRVKGANSKGKKWKKGQSCSSNPTKKNFRESAKNRFFQPQTGKSQLTQDALKQHESEMHESAIDSDDAMSQSAMSAGKFTEKTFSTWASNWTSCTNTTFSRIHRYWSSNSDLHKEILAVIAAVTEVIKEKEGEENETEYFAALMTTLEVSETVISKAATSYLLSLVIKKVSKSVLQSRFSDIARVFIDTLMENNETDMPTLLRSILLCLAQLLRVQSAARWSDPATVHVYQTLLVFSTHAKPKVRKAAQEAIRVVLKGSFFMQEDTTIKHHPASVQTAKFCFEKIEQSGGSGNDSSTTLYILGLLKYIMSTLPKNYLKILCETLLKLLTLSSVVVFFVAMQTLHAMFNSAPSTDSLPVELNGQLLTALYDYLPSENDPPAVGAWLSVMEKGVQNLINNNVEMGSQHAIKLFSTCMKFLQAERPTVQNSAFKNANKLLKNTLSPVKDALVSRKNTKDNIILKIFQAIEGGLSYQYHASWGKVLLLMASLFEIFGKHCKNNISKCLQTLADLRESHKFSYKGELEKAFGMALRHIGPRSVLKAVPLLIDGQNDNYEFPRSWILPLMRDYVQETELSYFITDFLPLAAQLRKKAGEFAEENRMVEARTYDALQGQIWSLLPAFCTKPIDLKQSFGGIAKVLGISLNERPDLRLEVLQSLRKLVTFSMENESNKSEMQKYAKNYIPILFNLYLAENKNDNQDKKRLAVLETIKVYFNVTESSLVDVFFNKCIQKIEEEKDSNSKKYALLDLQLAMIPFIKLENLSTLLKLALGNMKDADHTVQKKSYRVLEEMCSKESEDCKKCIMENLPQLQKDLLDSLSSSSPSSKGPRLNCLTFIVKHLESENTDFMETVLPEAILCTKEASSKARQAAFNLLLEMCRTLQRWRPDQSTEENIKNYLYMVLAGLAGSPHMISTTSLAVSKIVYYFKKNIEKELLSDLIEMVCALLSHKGKEVVDSALTLLKVLLGQFDREFLYPALPAVIKSLITMKEENKHHIRSKTKAIFVKLVKKFGFEIIRKSVPESMHKLLRGIKKKEDRSQRLKEKSKEEDSESENEFDAKAQPDSIEELLRDTDSEVEEDGNKESNKKKKKVKKSKETRKGAWIKEGDDDEIVDFLGGSLAKQVMASKPQSDKRSKEKDSNRGFKTTKDGKLIIADEEDEKSAKKPKAVKEEEIDNLSELLDAMGGHRKRKHKTAVDSDDEVPMKYQAGGSGIHRPTPHSNKTDSEDFGAGQYKSKKAGGDVKRKGKPDPFAYVPLQMSALNKRKKAKLAGKFKNIVKGAQKGAAKGQKARSKLKRK